MGCAICEFKNLVGCVAIRPAEICMRLVRGTTTTWEFILTDGKGEPVDITDDEVRLTIKDKPGGTIKIAKENGPGDHLDPSNGRTAFTIGPSEITESGTDILYWVYEVRRFHLSDEAIHITGPFVVDPSI